MAKQLRPNESISFVQTRAPDALWREVRTLACQYATGYVNHLCTNSLADFLQQRSWITHGWDRPRDLMSKKEGGSTGFRQVNLPLSNMDMHDQLIPTERWLVDHRVIDLFAADDIELDAALKTQETAQLFRLLGKRHSVSGATVGYTFLRWLHIAKFNAPGKLFTVAQRRHGQKSPLLPIPLS